MMEKELEIIRIERETLIVGAGVVGLAIAKAMVEKGLAVTLVDQSDYGTKASGTNLGQLSISDRECGLEYRLVQETKYEYEVVSVSRDLEYDVSGGLFILDTEKDIDKAFVKVDELNRQGYGAEMLLGEDVIKQEPNIKNILGAVYCSSEGKVNPLRVNNWLFDEGIKHGVEFIPGKEVKDFIVTANRIGGAVFDDMIIEAETVIVATGSWSKELLQKIGIDLEVDYVKASAMVTQPCPTVIRGAVAPGIFLTGNVAQGQRIFFGAVQTKSGSIILAQANKAGENYNTLVDGRDIAEVAQLVLKHYPMLKDIQVLRAWSGCTTITSDEKPYWGYTKKYANLFLAIAFKGAFSLAPSVGKHTSDWIADGDISDDFKIWSPVNKGI